MSVGTEVIQKVKDLLPGQIGTGLRWTDSYALSIVLAADHAACDRCEFAWKTQEIDLIADTAEYDLSASLLNVVSVEYSSDGTNYDDYLKPTTFSELDSTSTSWRDDAGIRPQWYVLLSCPGLPETTTDAGDSASIFIHRPLSSVSSQKIKVSGYRDVAIAYSIDNSIMDMVYVPFVLSVLLATADPQLSMQRYQEFLYGCDKARTRSV